MVECCRGRSVLSRPSAVLAQCCPGPVLSRLSAAPAQVGDMIVNEEQACDLIGDWLRKNDLADEALPPIFVVVDLPSLPWISCVRRGSMVLV